ncbi:MAG: hypothetical protein AELANPGJ_02815 [Anaerolineae bacterium]|nr:hypothetical protein [Anaerolineae bacterium]
MRSPQQAAPRDMPRVSVILVNYNAGSYVGPCLASVFDSAYPDIEVIVVDNQSTDGSADCVAEQFPSAKLIRAGANLGFSGGCNLGAQQASGEILAFLNLDTVVSPDWLAPLVDVLERDPHAGMATPKIVLLNDPALVNTYGNDVHFTGFGYLRAWQEPASGLTHTQEVAAISGAAFIMRAETFRELGGFDELFFPAYAEDADLSWRARIAGYRLYAVPQSVIRHDYRLHFSPAKFEFLERNRLQMLFKNYRWPTLVVLTPALMLAEVVGWGFAAVSGRRYWSAKLRGYGWIIRHWRTLMQHRRTVQGTRKAPDRDILFQHIHRLGFKQVGTGAALIAERIFNPLFWVLYHVSRGVVRW